LTKPKDFLRENFFQPLGMTNTGVYRGRFGLPHEALGYSLSPSALTWIFLGEGFSVGKRPAPRHEPNRAEAPRCYHWSE
jgi:CubicO group peptidase (beta-lactamase class C family)